MENIIIGFGITETIKDFAFAIKESIDSDNMLDKATSLYEGNSQLILFNRIQTLRYEYRR